MGDRFMGTVAEIQNGGARWGIFQRRADSGRKKFYAREGNVVFARNMAKTFAAVEDFSRFGRPRIWSRYRFGFPPTCETSRYGISPISQRPHSFLCVRLGVFERREHFLVNPEPEILRWREFYFQTKNITRRQTRCWGLKIFTF